MSLIWLSAAEEDRAGQGSASHEFAELIILAHQVLEQRKLVAEFVESNDELVARTAEVITDSVRLLRRLNGDGAKHQIGGFDANGRGGLASSSRVDTGGYARNSLDEA